MRAMTLIMAGAVLLASAPALAARPTTLDQQIDRLNQRVEKLEAVRAIKKLQRAFGYYVDRGL